MQPQPFFILRLHPKNTREEFACYLPEVDMVSQGGDPLDLVWISDLVLGLSSMLLMEAALVGRPTISIVPRECESEWSPSVTEGLTPCATTRNGLRKILANRVDTQEGATTLDAVASIREVVMECLEHGRSRNFPEPDCLAALTTR
jgi:predicted glycosyltransferase